MSHSNRVTCPNFVLVILMNFLWGPRAWIGQFNGIATINFWKQKVPRFECDLRSPLCINRKSVLSRVKGHCVISFSRSRFVTMQNIEFDHPSALAAILSVSNR